ncbi:MAG: DUF309 domain-containing protein [Verrucomicrobia bacterium]|nr:DUF309 domain-containing protein [Verrucomicrobiota bacterium]
MSKKSSQIAQRIESFHGQDLDAHYLGFFDCFNRQLFYEAHDVLEELWLADRRGPNGDFYKGLIQLAGAFVHLQKEHLRPAGVLFQLARGNLVKYAPVHERLEVAGTVNMVDNWHGVLDVTGFTMNPLHAKGAPSLTLLPG